MTLNIFFIVDSITASQHCATVSEYLAMVGVTMVFVAGWLLAACSPIMTKLQGEEELADTSATSGHNTHTSCVAPAAAT